MQTRRALIAMLAATVPTAALLSACEGGGGGGAPVGVDEEMSMGKADAPIVMVEYASVACPVCAGFAIQVLPDFKKKYIDSGQVRLITREMNAHNPALSTAGFLLARCAGKDKYYEVTDAIYRAQQEMEMSGQYAPGLAKIAKKAGLNQSQFEKCISDPAAIAAQNARVEKFAKQDNVSSTPTFVIDGQIVGEGLQDMQQLDAIIAAAKNRKAAPAPAPAAAAAAPK